MSRQVRASSVVRHAPGVQDDVARLLDALRAHYASRIDVQIATADRDATLTLMPGQRSAFSEVKRKSYVADLDHVTGVAEPAGDPIVEAVRDGFTADVEALPFGGGSHVRLTLRLSSAELERPIATAKTPGGEIRLPRLTLRTVRTSVLMPKSGSVSVAGFGPPDEEVKVAVAR